MAKNGVIKIVAVVVGVFLVGVIVMVVVGAQYLRSTPLTPAERSEIRVDWASELESAGSGAWTPWVTGDDGARVWNPAASFNAWLETVPDAARAWPVLMDVRHGSPELWDHPDLGSGPERADDWDELTRVLSEHRGQIDRLASALRRPRLGRMLTNTTDPVERAAMEAHGVADPGQGDPPEANPMLMLIHYPSLAAQRTAASALSSDAALALERGETSRFVDRVTAILGATDIARAHAPMLFELVELGVLGLGQSRVEDALLHETRLREPELAALDAALASARDTRFEPIFELLHMHDALRRVIHDDGTFARRSVMRFTSIHDDDALAEPSSREIDRLGDGVQRTLMVLHRVYGDIAERSVFPWNGEASEIGAAHRETIDKLGAAPKMLTEIMLPAVDKIWKQYHPANQRTVALRIALAAERHERRHGALPPSIASIDDDLLAFDPIDVFSGEPLRYALRDEPPGFVVYSVGSDRDDDGGVPMPAHNLRGPILSETAQARDPHWISEEEASAITRDEPERIDGDWVLVPAQE